MTLLLLSYLACSDKDIDDTDVPEGDADTDTDADTDVGSYDCGDQEDSTLCTAWIRSTGNTPLVDAGTPADVKGIALSGETWVISTSGLPSYTYTVSEDDITLMNSRQQADTDFVSGETTAVPGTTYDWGADVGFRSFSNGGQCDEGAGYGWWPPGPECPYDQDKSMTFPASPSAASTNAICETGLGASGYWINGVSIYNWGDGFAYDTDGQWRNVAPTQEAYDVGLCGGHAAGGDYHHHSYSACLAGVAGDSGDGHSPIYGFAADGYPIHGPWHANGEEAQSCWVARDYDSADEGDYGCGGTGERSCVMVDPLDPSKGTEAASMNGPKTSDSVTSLSGNVFEATQPLYYEDYYYDEGCTSAGGAALDAHNGHDHDALGYHYHVTTTFPFTLGPTLYGEVVDNGVNCDGVTTGMGM